MPPHKSPPALIPLVLGLAVAGLLWRIAWLSAPGAGGLPAALVGPPGPAGDAHQEGETQLPTNPRGAASRAGGASQEQPTRLGPLRFDAAQQRYVATYGGAEVPLTLEPEVQRVASRALTRGRPFFGATVVLAAKTGEVLALAETSQRTPERGGVALRADAPAASIFKLISAAALLHAGVPPNEPVCYQGGTRRLAPKHLKDRPGDRCVTFADVIPRSLNAAMAKLVNRHLPAGALHGMAERFGFGKTIAIEIPVEPSHAFIPPDPFGRAKTAAGFGDVRLSAFHAAAMTAVIANRGEWIPPRIIDESAAAALGVRLPPGPVPHGVIDPAIADALTHMMVETTESGTASRMMSKLPRGALLRRLQVGAKTGSLLFYDEHVDHSWLVAFAPAVHPEVVVATVIVNDWQLWYTKAGPVALEALEAGLVALRGRR